MSRSSVRSFVFAVEFRIAESERVGPVLAQHEESLPDLGAQYAFVYDSIVEPGKVLVAAGARTSRQVSDACGAGAECGRCRRTIRSIIDSQAAVTDSGKGSRV